MRGRVRRGSRWYIRWIRYARPVLGPLLWVAVTLVAPAAARAPVMVAVSRTSVVGVSQLTIGVTHTQESLDAWGSLAAVIRGKALLSSSVTFQNQHIMGWGVDNPEPSPGVYNWQSLDARINLIRATKGIPVITLCCAPDWMKGGRPGTTDWNKIDVAPTPDHYADFAALARQVALRYPDVRYYQVWNELKGFWNSATNTWDAAGYTKLYNMVYDALKSVNPRIQVGGPYVPIDSWADKGAGGWPARDRALYNQRWGTIDQRSLDVISYWLAHKHGADFIALDADNTPRDAPLADPLVGNEKFVAIMAWLRRQPHGGATLPIWWSEWYADSSADTNLPYSTAIMAEGLVRTLRGGAAAVLIWGPQGNAAGISFPVGLFTDTQERDGGKATALYPVLEAFRDDFGPGTRLYEATSSSPDVRVLASATTALLIDTRPVAIPVTVNGIPVGLGPYGVRVVTLGGA